MILAPVVIAALSAVVVPARVPDPCGDPKTVSDAYVAFDGTVREAIDSVTILVVVDQQPPGFGAVPQCSANPCRVRLVNLLAPTNPKVAALGKQHLAELCAGKRVSLLINDHQPTPGVVNAVAEVDDVNLNEAQLAAGFARYTRMAPYAVNWYMDCRLERAQDSARHARLGLWQNQ